MAEQPHAERRRSYLKPEINLTKRNYVIGLRHHYNDAETTEMAHILTIHVINDSERVRFEESDLRDRAVVYMTKYVRNTEKQDGCNKAA